MKTAEGTLPAALRAAAHHLDAKRQVLGCPRRLKGLAAGIVISWCCCKQLLTPGPVDGNAEQAGDDDVAAPQP